MDGWARITNRTFNATEANVISGQRRHLAHTSSWPRMKVRALGPTRAVARTLTAAVPVRRGRGRWAGAAAAGAGPRLGRRDARAARGRPGARGEHCVRPRVYAVPPHAALAACTHASERGRGGRGCPRSGGHGLPARAAAAARALCTRASAHRPRRHPEPFPLCRLVRFTCARFVHICARRLTMVVPPPPSPLQAVPARPLDRARSRHPGGARLYLDPPPPHSQKLPAVVRVSVRVPVSALVCLCVRVRGPGPDGCMGACRYHRQVLVDRLGASEGEPAFVARILAEDGKNYHAWSYRYTAAPAPSALLWTGVPSHVGAYAIPIVHPLMCRPFCLCVCLSVCLRGLSLPVCVCQAVAAGPLPGPVGVRAGLCGRHAAK
jgi:hypothetical protein